ncbi:MAG TPA: phage holin family protein [Candidatus Jeotgalibaca merdavium]|uniref:Phage holin family protein n=1 Tax=Candidatus Jeotgalibaca merdavium TaxID=2838627 RepID=A0A9D2I0U4_9LACT|nr:phage holin family protein [Candidatus Jeotgalibaca merdavium]
MEMIDWLQNLLQNNNTKLYLFVGTYIATNMVDFGLGTIMALYLGTYSSKAMKLGLATKLGMILLCIIIIPVFLMFDVLGLATLFLVIGAFIANELWSIINHIKSGQGDGKDHSALDMLSNLINKITGNKED